MVGRWICVCVSVCVRVVNPKAGVEKGCRVTAGKKMIAIAHAMAMAVPKPPADPLAARGCPA